MSKTRHTKEVRHPGGTRAEGLRKDYNGWIKVAYDRNRSGDAYEQSSRMRRMRRAVLHAARLKRKKELDEALESFRHWNEITDKTEY